MASENPEFVLEGEKVSGKPIDDIDFDDAENTWPCEVGESCRDTASLSEPLNPILSVVCSLYSLVHNFTWIIG